MSPEDANSILIELATTRIRRFECDAELLLIEPDDPHVLVKVKAIQATIQQLLLRENLLLKRMIGEKL